MQKMMIEIPDELALQFAPYQDRLRELMLLGLSQIKAQEALALYSRGLISFARGRVGRPAISRHGAPGSRPRP